MEQYYSDENGTIHHNNCAKYVNMLPHSNTAIALLVPCTTYMQTLAQFLLIQVRRVHSYSYSNSFIIIKFICILPPIHGAAVKVSSIVVAPYKNSIDFLQRWWQSQSCQCFWKAFLQFI